MRDGTHDFVTTFPAESATQKRFTDATVIVNEQANTWLAANAANKLIGASLTVKVFGAIVVVIKTIAFTTPE